MAFGVRLGSDVVSVEAGATVPFTVEVENKGASDRFEIQIEGLDPEWTAVPEPVMAVEADATLTEKVFFKPARVPESMAGNYPFAVKVRSLETGESRSVQAVLQIKPYHNVSMDISPRRGFTSPARSNNVFAATLVNLGNAEHTFQLFGNDPDGGLAFEFESEEVALGPGQQKTVEVAVDATKNNLIAAPRLFGFSISARSKSLASVNTTAQAQLEQRPLLSIATILFSAFMLAILGGWWALMPKPARLSLWAEKTVVQRGEVIRISWNVEHASGVSLRYNGQTVTLLRSTGSQEIPSDALGGTMVVEGAAIKDGREVASQTVTVDVKVPEPAPDPKIETFSVNQREIPLGSTFIVKYKFNKAVVKAYLQPLPDPLPIELNELQVTPTAVGRLEYTLVAQNADGKTVRDSVSVNVFQKTEAVILDFSASPPRLISQEGSVIVRWQTSNARRVIVQASDQERKVYTGTQADQGEETYIISRDTRFTITAYDANGLSAARTIQVKVALPDPELTPPLKDGISGDPEPFPSTVPPPKP